MSAQSDVDDIGVEVHGAVHNGKISFFGVAMFELMGQTPMGGIGFGHDDDAGGVAVQAMNDTGTEGVIDMGERITVIDKTIDKGAAGIAARRVNDKIRLFVDDQNLIVLVENIEGDRLGRDFGDGRWREDHVNAVAGVELITGFGGAAINSDGLFLDESLNGGAGEVRKAMLEVFVDPALGQQSFDFQTGALPPIVLER